MLFNRKKCKTTVEMFLNRLEVIIDSNGYAKSATWVFTRIACIRINPYSISTGTAPPRNLQLIFSSRQTVRKCEYKIPNSLIVPRVFWNKWCKMTCGALFNKQAPSQPPLSFHKNSKFQKFVRNERIESLNDRALKNILPAGRRPLYTRMFSLFEPARRRFKIN